MSESTLNSALRRFEATEANLMKAEKLLGLVISKIPSGICFGSDESHEDSCHDFERLYESLPKISGWKPQISLMDLDQIAQSRLDAEEVGDIECKIAVVDLPRSRGRFWI